MATSTPAPAQPLNILILGAGIAGLTTALALTTFLTPTPLVTIFELRPTPGALGGAVNLTPTALRYLSHLDVLSVIRERGFGADVDCIELFNHETGELISKVDFGGLEGKGYGRPGFKALRILRAELVEALAEKVRGLEGVEVRYGCHVTGIVESDDGVRATFADGREAIGDMLLGCDGINSRVRELCIEPERMPSYTGIAVAQGFVKVTPELAGGLHFKDTGLIASRRGSLITSFFTPGREEVYLAAVMETPDVLSREGWKVKGADQGRVREDIRARFVNGVIPCVVDLLADEAEWFLYPVSSLKSQGKWFSEGGRVMLLGDAAHAMPPQGESTGFAMEDAVMFSRVLAHSLKSQMEAAGEEQGPSQSEINSTTRSDVFLEGCKTFDRIRRPHIEASYADAERRWETVKDSGWFAHNLKMWLIPAFLWWQSSNRQKHFEEDLVTSDLGL